MALHARGLKPKRSKKLLRPRAGRAHDNSRSDSSIPTSVLYSLRATSLSPTKSYSSTDDSTMNRGPPSSVCPASTKSIDLPVSCRLIPPYTSAVIAAAFPATTSPR
ncbi:hypothetical protein PG995_014393 [Apiospora arundinis]